MLIGISTTIVAAIFLGYTTFGPHDPFKELIELLPYYIPRVTTIIFIEVFAFFFLKLYKNTLQEIKYFQNELTSIELKKTAFEAALISTHNKPMEDIISKLIQTERNSIKDPLTETGGEGGLSVKDINSVIEVVGKVAGKN